MLDAEANTRTPHVLFVDDEPLMRAAFLRLAKGRGLTAETAATAAEAIALAQSEEYDIVVTDVCMPGMSGAQLLQHLVPILPAAKFVVVTGAELSELTLDPPIERRLLSVLRKPWNNDQLIDTLVRGQQGRIRQLPSHAPSEERSLKILVIEDDPDHFELLQLGLSRSQRTAHHLERASSLGQARQFLERGESYDMILTDLGLPDSQGLETVILLRAGAPEVPIVVLTGRQDEALAMRALRAGAQDVVHKGSMDGFAINRALQYAVERASIERGVLEMSRTDPLTGLGNRTMFRERVALALARARRKQHSLAVLYLDLDRFKRINDQLGHDAGDAFLQETARRLAANVREYDCVARFGGDEFAILLDGLSSERDVIPLVERLLAALRSPTEVCEGLMAGSASIGIAMYPQCSTTDELIEAADTALYQSKRGGRDRFCLFGASMQEALRRRLRLESDLSKAHRARQFELFYQKQVSLGTGALVGMEALLRWKRDSGYVSPQEFVPILEETGLILDVGHWVLDNALQQLRRWRHLGALVPRISVNVSVRQFIHPGFAAFCAKALEENKVYPPDLEIEITEAALSTEWVATKATAQALHALGVRLAIDDFGTGSSSLKCLLELPIDTLKIDRSFVDGLDTDDRHATILRAVLGMGHALGVDVVAKGLEEVSQYQVLMALGCKFAQGYYFHRPVAAETIDNQLEVRRRLNPLESPRF